jgi:protein involved in polysaccharide export with SLBB domain
MSKEQLNRIEAVLFVYWSKSMSKQNPVLLLTVVLAILLIGCETQNSTMVDTRDFMKSSPKTRTVQATELASGDTIEISVEVDGSIEVARQLASINYRGIVTLPLVGDVKVGGLNMEIARAVIAKRYGVYYVTEPVIMVSRIDEDAVSEWGQITVLGRVNRPGVVPLTTGSGMSLSAAIQTAGGFASSAKANDIRVSRINKQGRKIQVSVNFDEIGKSGNAEADINLLAGDIVFVPERIF